MPTEQQSEESKLFNENEVLSKEISELKTQLSQLNNNYMILTYKYQEARSILKDALTS